MAHVPIEEGEPTIAGEVCSDFPPFEDMQAFIEKGFSLGTFGDNLRRLTDEQLKRLHGAAADTFYSRAMEVCSKTEQLGDPGTIAIVLSAIRHAFRRDGQLGELLLAKKQQCFATEALGKLAAAYLEIEDEVKKRKI